MVFSKKIVCIFLIVSGLLIFSAKVYADSVPALPKHTDSRWQELTSIKWTTDQTYLPSDTIWGVDTVSVGDVVTFKFAIVKDFLGTHYADVLKAWLSEDWNFTESEKLAFDFHIIHENITANSFPGTDLEPPNDTYNVYSTITITSDMAGKDYWLLARVTCTESLFGGDWNGQWGKTSSEYEIMFDPTKEYYQGNAKKTKFSVDPVPEPTTVLLFGAGLIGLAGVARRKK